MTRGPANFEDLSDESLELRLVSDTTLCRSCDWFWRPPAYGPYTAFRFQELYPEVLRERSSRLFRDGDHTRDVPGICSGQQFVDPQLLHGCRKAPVTTIGINPNLTAFWPGTRGARWAYPYFETLAEYAYYYRHRTVHQEALKLDFIRSHLEENGALIASDAGRVVAIQPDWADRSMTITLEYESGERVDIHQTWTEDQQFVLLYDRAWSAESQFVAGDVIGGFLTLPDGVEVSVEQRVVGYYQRVVPILEHVSSFLRSLGHLPSLQMAEDCNQLDMVACASPGWSGRYQIDKDEVVDQCVIKNAWVVKQLIQINPAVIVFSGRSAFEMFAGLFRAFIGPELFTDMDVYGLMKYTARDPHYLEIKSQDDGQSYHLRARILIGPHFSYDDNYAPHCRLSEEEWEQFMTRHVVAATQLVDDERVTEPNRDGYRGIRIDEYARFGRDFPAAMIELMRKYYDPTSMIGEAIAQEILLGNIAFDEQSGHLSRAQGGCRFCVNSKWSFPEGCAYGKPNESQDTPGLLNAVTRQILDAM